MNKKEIKRKRSFFEAQKAIRILEKEIAKIRYVQDWAFWVGCSKSKLNHLMKGVFDKSAKAVMKEIRFKKIKQTIKNDQDFGSYAIAKENGLVNERELYKFLNRNFVTSFTELQLEILWVDDTDVQNG